MCCFNVTGTATDVSPSSVMCKELRTVAMKLDDTEGTEPEVVTVTINANDTSAFNTMWRECVGSGHAALWSRADWREHIKIVSTEIGFKYLRGHGILDNAVMFYDACPNDGNHTVLSPKGQPGDTSRCIPEKDGSLGSYWDAFSAYDFMLSVGVKPIVELSFTPNPLVVDWHPGMPNPQECTANCNIYD